LFVLLAFFDGVHTNLKGVFIEAVANFDAAVGFNFHFDGGPTHIEIVGVTALKDQSAVTHKGLEVVPVFPKFDPTFLNR
jgi:hypothetical protein